VEGALLFPIFDQHFALQVEAVIPINVAMVFDTKPRKQ
jgi:hypothetical protein